MTAPRFLYLSARGLDLYARPAAGLHLLDHFAADSAGVAAFGQRLAQDQVVPYALLVNGAEEGFQHDAIPVLHGRDRQAVIKGRLRQAFFDTPYATALPQGREKSPRKHEHLLLAALTQPPLLAPWLDALAQRGLPLSGIYSVAQLTPLLLPRLGAHAHAPHLLLLTLQDESLRQSYFVRGQLRISRLTPLADRSPHALGRTLQGEAETLARYLLSQRLWPREDNQPLPTLVLATAALQPFLAQPDGTSPPLAQVAYHDLGETARQLGLATRPDEHRADTLFLELLAQRPPRQQFAPAALRHEHRLWQARRLLLRGSASILLASLPLSGWQAYQGLALSQQAQALRQANAERARQYNTRIAAFPPQAVSGDNLRAVTARYHELAAQTAPITPLLAAISRALDAMPQVELSALEWSQSEPSPSLPGTATHPDAPMQHAVLRGQLQLPPPHTIRSAMVTFDALVQRLRRESGGQVAIVQAPYDLEPNTPLHHDSKAATDPAAPAFALRVSLPLPPPSGPEAGP